MTSPVAVSSPMLVRVESTNPCAWSVTEPPETKYSAASRAKKVIVSGAKACGAKAQSAKVIAFNAKASAAKVLARRRGNASAEEPVSELSAKIEDADSDLVTPIEKPGISDFFPFSTHEEEGLEVMSLGSSNVSTGINEPRSLPGSVDDSDCSLPGSIPASAGSDAEGL
eukprot:gnl/MRDRNA2_/MRDRNA2_29174_c0_seq1.p1 gnl/MRDRNA2_/MRDRNA2_29174_c0~~gnl/MRDRNA2_/MRDRNA2_29174_c0_seq1.p1  ORF type:complete len:196 (+),score=44.40 gnl/MRDRNA2_/MRDRNA2_29174_c0_seq1:83-589(+)